MLTNEVCAEDAAIQAVPAPPFLILFISLLLLHLLEQLGEQGITVASVHFPIGLELRGLESVEANLNPILSTRRFLILIFEKFVLYPAQDELIGLAEPEGESNGARFSALVQPLPLQACLQKRVDHRPIPHTLKQTVPAQTDLFVHGD